MAALTDQDVDELYSKIDALIGTSDEVTINEPDIISKLGGIMKRRLVEKGIVITSISSDKASATFARGTAAIASSMVASATTAPASVPAPKERVAHDLTKHTLFLPPNYKRIKSLLEDNVPAVPFFIGPAGCAKTTIAEHIAQELGLVYFQFSCTPQTQIVHMMGKTELVTDKESGQSVTNFALGTVLQAATCGLDEAGNEVGQAGLLCLDEFGSLDEGTALLFNGFWTEEARRKITYEGKTYYCHSKFRVILTGNNAGRGNNSMTQSVYTAQASMKDASTLDRIYPFRFGYMAEAEKKIMLQRTGDDEFVAKMAKFAAQIRSAIKTGECQTPFTTRTLIKISNAYRVWGDMGYALRNAVYDGLASEQERAVYSVAAQTCLAIDIAKKANDGGGIEYMD
jgi:hypothetical protein